MKSSWLARMETLWKSWESRHPTVVQFLVFFLLSNGVTVLQMVLMPLLKAWFENTSLVSTSFQIGAVGTNFNGTPYYVFDYAAGSLASGGGGGLAYFLAVQISLAVAQVINFFLQRNITFRSRSNPWVSAFWYLVAYLLITLGAAALQGLYKAPLYDLLINGWGWGRTGETVADVVTMFINSAISFWVFFPIFKVIFPQEKAQGHEASVDRRS